MQIEARVEALVVARFEAQVEARGWRRRLEAPGYRCGPVEAWGEASVEAWVEERNTLVWRRGSWCNSRRSGGGVHAAQFETRMKTRGRRG